MATPENTMPAAKPSTRPPRVTLQIRLPAKLVVRLQEYATKLRLPTGAAVEKLMKKAGLSAD